MRCVRLLPTSIIDAHLELSAYRLNGVTSEGRKGEISDIRTNDCKAFDVGTNVSFWMAKVADLHFLLLSVEARSRRHEAGITSVPGTMEMDPRTSTPRLGVLVLTNVEVRRVLLSVTRVADGEVVEEYG